MTTATDRSTQQNSNRSIITCVGLVQLVCAGENKNIPTLFDEGSAYSFCNTSLVTNAGYTSNKSWTGSINSLCEETPVRLPIFIIKLQTINGIISIPCLGLETVGEKTTISNMSEFLKVNESVCSQFKSNDNKIGKDFRFRMVVGVFFFIIKILS